MAPENDSSEPTTPPGEVYLVVPAEGNDGARTMVDASNVNQAVARGLWGGRKEVPSDTEKVETQINNYVTIIQGVAEREETKETKLRLSEITLSLTLSAEGNIGIASTSAEAGISLVFKRS
ncbi:Pepco domain-containing protein [Tropicimonas marinistellae]|uniref:Pepco domain-containing protein n=1 Tax=Tropicimonas marinistellae TaxID=1739787 RepID=UPI00082D3768|nr:hypothetical protein [Tropicimonas marinistellae]